MQHRRTRAFPRFGWPGAMATVAAVLSVAAMTAAADPVSHPPGSTLEAPSIAPSPLFVAEARANVFTRSAQENTSLDVGPGGRVVLAWDSRRQEAGTSGIYARAFDPLGRPLTHEVHVNRYVRGQQRLPGVAFAGDDAVWFVWDSGGQDGQAGSIVARRFHADLTPSGPELAVNAARDGDQTRPVVAGRPDGSAIVAWMTTLPGPGARTAIRARQIGPDGRVTGTEIEPGAPGAGRDALPALASLPDGGTFLVWARSAAGRKADGIRGRMIGVDGTLKGSELRISPADGRTHIEPSVAADAEGRFVVSWLTGVDDGYAVTMRRFDADGAPLGGARTIADPSTGWKSGVAVAAAPDGRFVVSFNSDGEDGDDEGIFARVFDDAGREVSRMRVNRRTEGRQAMTVAGGARRVAWSPLGHIAFAWSGDAGTADKSAANMTILTPADLEVAAPPDIGEPRPAAPVSSEEYVAANPPIWDPDFEPIAPLPRDATAGGDFGFEAVTYSGWTPPDPEAAVGPTDIVVMTNGEIATFTKAGVNRWRDEIENTFGFWGELGTDNFVFDPEVQWDPHARRFFAMACERSDNFRSNFLLAVSKDESPDDRNDWYKYRLDVTALAGNDIDSPNLAMSADYVLLTADFFGPDKYLVYIIDKSSILNGGTPVTTSELITGAGQQSMGIPVVYDVDGPLYILQSTEFSNNTQVIFHAISNPFTAYNRQTYTLTVPAYQYPNEPPQKGSSSRPFLFEPRFWSTAQRNGSIWAVRGGADPPDTFRAVQVVQTSANAHTSGRWGDYSGTQADSDDPGIFWGHHEFTNGASYTWRTWVARYDVRPDPMVLKVDPLVAGATADLTVNGATPGSTVYFAYSLSGTALTEVAPLNVTLSIENPVPIAGALADPSGTATISVPIPPAAAGLDVWIQALEPSHTTNWVATTIQ